MGRLYDHVDTNFVYITSNLTRCCHQLLTKSSRKLGISVYEPHQKTSIAVYSTTTHWISKWITDSFIGSPNEQIDTKYLQIIQDLARKLQQHLTKIVIFNGRSVGPPPA